MLCKEKRIRKKKDFEHIFKSGKSVKEKIFALKFCPNGLESARFAFVISQKVSKKAVIRNKIRRRLASIIKECQPEIKKGMDAVFVVFPGAESADFLQTREFVLKTLKKAGLI